MICINCLLPVKKERWEVIRGKNKEIYCYSCFANEWGDYLEGVILIDGYVKKDKKQMKLKYYELDLKFKKYFISEV